jgi:hypothetical protein
MIVVRLVRERVVIRESVFAGLPITIGRGPDNDFVVVDPSVSRRHARLEEGPDGVPVLRDAGSRNGIRVGGKTVAETSVPERLRIRLGRVELEIESVAEAETKELRREEWRRLSKKRGGFRVLGTLLMGVLGWLAFQALEADFWSPWQKNRALTLLSNGIMVLLMLPILAFVLLIILRTVGRSVRLSDTLVYLAGIIWLFPASAVTVFFAYYPLSSAVHSAFSSIFETVVVIVALVGAASLRRSRPSARFRMIWATALLAVFAAFSLLTHLEQRRNGVPQMKYEIQMPIFGFSGRSQSLETYLARLQRKSEIAASKASEIHARQKQLEH